MLLALVAGIGWYWWHQRERPVSKSTPASQPTTTVTAPPPPPRRTNAPGLVTNLVLLPTNPPPPPPQPKPEPRPPAADPSTFPRSPRDVLETQIALARRGISSGSIDGVLGSQTRAALQAFQRQARLVQTSELDDSTTRALPLDSAPLTRYVVTPEDLARLQPVSKTWLGKSSQTALDYETILELVAERGHASPTLIRRLNPGVNWTNVTAGTEFQIPDAPYPAPTAKAAFVVISLAGKSLEAFDAQTNLLAHFPCSIAARVEKRPVGALQVTAIAENPNYTLNPEVFPESAEVQALGRKLILPPGPNNPVGTAWISLDRPGYGMHGTPSPEQVGRTESHGCFRLANWNANHLVKLVWVGLPVYVSP